MELYIAFLQWIFQFLTHKARMSLVGLCHLLHKVIHIVPKCQDGIVEHRFVFELNITRSIVATNATIGTLAESEPIYSCILSTSVSLSSSSTSFNNSSNFVFFTHNRLSKKRAQNLDCYIGHH